jgi:hypothetical protein
MLAALWTPEVLWEGGGAALRGGDLAAGRLFVWGDGVWSIDPGERSWSRLATANLGEGGCVTDVNGDGIPDVMAPSSDGMVWLGAPEWTPRVIDDGARFQDCLGAILFGRRGVLVVHQGIQVRFYEPPREPDGKWSYREIYSIYTPSFQAGLLLADVDGDGRPDILNGNYWIRSPERFDLGWRLFAIQDWWEGPESAAVKLTWLEKGKRLVAAQSKESPARFAVFTRPADLQQFWYSSPVAESSPVGGLAVAEGGIVVGERNGRVRAFSLDNGWKPVAEGHGGPVLGMWPVSGGVLSLEPSRVVLWPTQRPPRR